MLYITLLDNSSQHVFPENRLSHFTTLLSTPLKVGEGAEMALCELFLPFSFRNLDVNDAYFELVNFTPTGIPLGQAQSLEGLEKLLETYGGSITLNNKRYKITLPEGFILTFQEENLGLPKAIFGDNRLFTIGEPTEQTELLTTAQVEKVTSTSKRVSLKPNYYGTIEKLIAEINSNAREEIKLTINATNGLVKCDSKARSVKFSAQLANILGFRGATIPEGSSYARYRFDQFPGSSVILVYCSEVTDQFVGHSFSPILRVLPLRKVVQDEMISYTCDQLQFRPIKHRELSSITISLLDEIGRELSFEQRGRVAATIAIRSK